MLGLGALAAFGAAEVAVIYAVAGFIVELAVGVDLPLIGLVQVSDYSAGDVPEAMRY